MFDASLYAFLGLSIAVVVLAAITAFLATQHDRAVTQSGPLEQLAAIEARIRGKQVIERDLDSELQKRRDALAHIADIQTEHDSLLRRLDEMRAEWGQSEARRAEILAIRHETEAARTDKLAVDAELSGARADLQEVRDRLARAEELVHSIDSLTAQAAALETEVNDKRAVLHELQDASAKLAKLAQETRNLGAEKDRIEGRISAGQAELAELENRLVSSRTQAADLRQVLDATQAELAAARQRQADLSAEATAASARLAALEVRAAELAQTDAMAEKARGTLQDLAREAERMEAELVLGRQKVRDLGQEAEAAGDRIAALESRKAVLEREIEKARGLAAGGTGAEVADPLQELKERPQVISRLIEWPMSGVQSEAEALKRVKMRLEAANLTYPDRVLRAFHTSMKVNDTTQMTVLAGISGTGKSQLPRQYAAGMGIGFLQVPVQPRWDSPQDLMGFYNYIEGKFRPTDMARALFAMDAQNNPEAVGDRVLMILLDEMNLARVEYYFSDFLSRLESRPGRGREGDRNLRKDAEIELEIPQAITRIFPGYNLLFAGTMNEDESTQSLSDKVVDRANVMRFGAPQKIVGAAQSGALAPEQALSRQMWDKWCSRPLASGEASQVDARVQDMLDLMQAFGKPFGHRLGRAIQAYVTAYPDAEGIGSRVNMALADQIEMRLLPKLRGVDVEDMADPFRRLQALAADCGDDGLANAIESSVSAASATGQFVWRGVVR